MPRLRLLALAAAAAGLAASCRAEPPAPVVAEPAPSASEGAMVRSAPSASGSAPEPPAPAAADADEGELRWMAGPPRALWRQPGGVLLLDPEARSELRLAPGEGAVFGAVESLAGDRIAVLYQTTLRVYGTSDGTLLADFPCPQRPGYSLDGRPVAFRADGKVVAAACGKTLLFEVDSGKVLASVAPASSLAFHAESSALVTLEGSEVNVWDPSTGASLLGKPRSLGDQVVTRLSPDGRWIVAAPQERSDWTPGQRSAARLFRSQPFADLGLVGREERPPRAVSAEFSPDGGVLFVRGAVWAQALDPSTRRELGFLRNPPTSADYPASLSRDGERAALFSELGSSVVNARTGASLAQLEGRAHAPSLLSPDGAFLLEPAHPGLILRSATSGRVLLRAGERPPALPTLDAASPTRQPEDKGFEHVDWMPDARHLLARGASMGRYIDVASGASVEVGRAIGELLHVRLSPGRDRFLLAGSEGVEVRRVDGGELLGTIKAPMQGEAASLALSHDGQLLAHVGSVIRVWDVASSEPRHQRAAPIWSAWSGAFTADPDVLVVAGPASFALLELSSGKRLGDEHGTGTGATFPTSISPDGRWVGAGSDDGHTARVWATYPFHFGPDLVYADGCTNHTSASFSSDSSRAIAWARGGLETFEVGTWRRIKKDPIASPDLRALDSDLANRKGIDPNLDKHTARIVDLSTGRALVSLEGEIKGELAMSSDGLLVAEAAGDEVLLRSARSGKITARLRR